MGVNSINSFMKSMAVEAEIEGRKLTNHSARKTLVKKLKAANQPRSAIIGVTGHTNERSLADYEEDDENEQRLISSISAAHFIYQCGGTNRPNHPSSAGKNWRKLRCIKHSDDE